MFRYVFFIISLISLASSAAFSQGSAREWIIDTDVGIDDVIAILYVLNQNSMPVKAITIESDGNAHCQAAYLSLKGILRLAKQTQIPVACGRSTPLRGNHQFPMDIIQSQDNLAKIFPDKLKLVPAHQSAKALLINTLKSTAQPINILAIGPLTTLAEITEEHPELKNKIHHIYIMGGAIKAPGNIKTVDPQNANEAAEWNIYIDPYAAEKLFHSGIALTLVPLDVTQTALIDQQFYEDLQNRQDSAAAQLVLALFNQNKEMLRKKEWYFWDPMAAVIAQNDSLCQFETMTLSVKQIPESQSGATVIDKKQGAKLRVCMGINTFKFRNELLQGLNSTKKIPSSVQRKGSVN